MKREKSVSGLSSSMWRKQWPDWEEEKGKAGKRTGEVVFMSADVNEEENHAVNPAPAS